MWDHVGIIHTNAEFNDVQKQLQQIKQQTDILSKSLTKSFIELRNITTVANLIIKSVLLRKESRGLDCNKDYPQTDLSTKNTILYPSDLERVTYPSRHRRIQERNQEIKIVNTMCDNPSKIEKNKISHNNMRQFCYIYLPRL